MKKLIILILTVLLTVSAFGLVLTANAIETTDTYGKALTDWKQPWGAGSIVNGGYQPTQYDSLKEGIASDYIGITVEIAALADNNWVAVQLTGNPAHDQWNGTGAHVKFSKSGSVVRLDIYGFGGVGITENNIFSDLIIAECPQILIELIYDGTDFTLRVNEKSFKNSTHMTAAQFRDENGKTYINFSKDGSDWTFRFMDITTKVPYGRAISEWKNPIEIGSVSDGRYRTFAVDGIKEGIASDFLRVDMNIEALSNGSWISMQLTGNTNSNSWDGSGMHIVFRDNGSGGLMYSIYGSKTIAENQSLGVSISSKPRVTVTLIYDGLNYSLKVNQDFYHKNDASEIKNITAAHMRDENGKTFVNFNAYGTDQHLNTIFYVNLVSDRLIGVITASDMTPPVISIPSNHFKYGYAGQALTLPSVTANDLIDGACAVTAKVIRPDSTEVEIIDGAFTADVMGEYTVEYTARDFSNNSAKETRKVLIVSEDADIAFTSSYNAPWGGLSQNEGSVDMVAHAALLKPISFETGYLKTTIDIKALWDGYTSDPQIEAWVSVAFLKAPSYSDPASTPVNGLYLMFSSQNGKLYTSVIMAGPLGVEYICIKDGFTAQSDAIGQVEIVLEQYKNNDDEDLVSLHINGNRCNNEYMNKAYLSDIMNANGDMFIGYGSYDSDPIDALAANYDCRRISLLSLESIKEIDEELPVIVVNNVPSVGKVDEQITLPTAAVTDNSGETIFAILSVKDPDNIAVSVINNKFTPTKAGNYTVTYTATDSSDNTAYSTFTIVVAEKEVALRSCSASTGDNMIIGLIMISALLMAAKKKFARA